jgi:hypothetical protein
MKKLLLFALLFISLPVFGQKISNLPSAVTPTGGEFLPMVQSGQTVKVTPLQLLTYIAAQGITWSAAQQMNNGLTVLNGLTLSSGNLGVTSGNLTLSSGTLTASGLVTAQNGLTVSSGNLSVAGTSTLTGAVTASNGLTATAGGVTVTAGNFSQSGTGNSLFSSTGYLFSSEEANPSVSGVANSGVSVGTDSGTTVGNPQQVFIDEGFASNERAFGCKMGALSSHDFACFTMTDAGGYGSTWVDVVRSGTTVSSVNFPSGTLESSGYPVLVFAEINVSGTSCSLNTNFDNLNYSSCTRNSAGNYTVTFSVTFPNKPTCEITAAQGTFGVAQGASTSTTVVIEETNFSGTAADEGSVNFSCH